MFFFFFFAVGERTGEREFLLCVSFRLLAAPEDWEIFGTALLHFYVKQKECYKCACIIYILYAYRHDYK